MRALGDILYNFHWIVPGTAARAAQAYAGFLGAFLKKHSIASVINLRGPNPKWRWWRYEKRVCENLGVQHFDVRLSSKHLPSRDMLMRLIETFDTAPAPVLLKCSGGQDRTSFAAALYILHVKGWDGMGDALAQFARWPYLHLPKRHQRWLKAFIEFAREDAKGTPLRAWIDDGYASANLKAWLEARGLGGGFVDVYPEPGVQAER